jgi:hypothetical protein
MSSAQRPAGEAFNRAATVRSLEKGASALAGAALARMDETLPWYRAMPAEHRSWVGLVAQTGIATFLEWYRQPETPPSVTADVFGTAPRELARAVTLQQTVELVRTTIAVIEERVVELATPDAQRDLREAVLLYSREVAFAAAAIYAQAAETRGAWDARLEALVVDAIVRGEADVALRSRAAALGWGAPAHVLTLTGLVAADDPEEGVERLQRAARTRGVDVLTGVHGNRLLAILGAGEDPLRAVRPLAALFGPGPVVIGPVVDDLLSAGSSAEEAASGLRAAAGWPEAPRPVLAADLLPERALDGDPVARRRLVEETYRPLQAAEAGLLDTLATYLEVAGSLEATARALFVHPNTVRYRLRRVTDLTGFSPTEARDAFHLRVSLVLGRLADSGPSL